jgi:cytidylate kinase
MDHYVITIARGYGSGGKTMGKLLAEELGIHFYDRELLRLASDESGINEDLFGRADEQLKQSLLYKIARKEYKGELIPPDREDFISNDNLFQYQAKVIKDLAEQESCIIVGRCADYILKDRKNVIKIFVHASQEDCVARLESMGMFSLSRKELEKKITAIDKRRAEYYKYYTGRNWEDAKNYDLCLNSQQLGFDKCIQIVKNYIDVRGN